MQHKLPRAGGFNSTAMLRSSEAGELADVGMFLRQNIHFPACFGYNLALARYNENVSCEVAIAPRISGIDKNANIPTVLTNVFHFYTRKIIGKV